MCSDIPALLMLLVVLQLLTLNRGPAYFSAVSIPLFDATKLNS